MEEEGAMDVPAALKAICRYGKGRCWHCDRKLPRAERAIRDGWDVQRVEGQAVANIILVCPACLHPRETAVELPVMESRHRPKRHRAPLPGPEPA